MLAHAGPVADVVGAEVRVGRAARAGGLELAGGGAAVGAEQIVVALLPGIDDAVATSAPVDAANQRQTERAAEAAGEGAAVGRSRAGDAEGRAQPARLREAERARIRVDRSGKGERSDEQARSRGGQAGSALDDGQRIAGDRRPLGEEGVARWHGGDDAPCAVQIDRRANRSRRCDQDSDGERRRGRE